jgi:hypothetical protein
MAGFTAAAFVRLLENNEKAALAYYNQVQARMNKHEYELAIAGAELHKVRELLSEGRKLMNAVIDGAEFVIQKDGTVRVDKPLSTSQTVVQQSLKVD